MAMRGHIRSFLPALGFAGLFAGCSYTTPEIAAKGVVGGYYRNPPWQKALPPEEIKYENYTHIFHAFLMADETGAVETREGAMPCRDLARLAHRHGVKVLLSLGGSGSGKTFSAITARDDTTRRYARAVVDLMSEHDYDGVDIDWEHPQNAADQAGWSKLAAALREGMNDLGREKKRKYLLTTALPGGDWAGKWVGREAVLAHIDFINVMAYDHFGPWGGLAGNHAPLFAAKDDPRRAAMADAMAYWSEERRIPRDRLVLGVPFYSFLCQGYEPYEQIDASAEGKTVRTVSWMDVARLAREEDWKRTFDEPSQAAWYHAPDGKAFVAADDPEIIAIKTRWAKGSGYRGVFCWCMDHDIMADGETPLSDAMTRSWREHGTGQAIPRPE